MKTIVVLLVCASVACLFLEANADCEQMDKSGVFVPTGTEIQVKCAVWKCDDQGAWSSSGCPEWRCQGEPISQREQDDSKPFPECCPGPICAESEE